MFGICIGKLEITMKSHYRFILFFILGWIMFSIISCTNSPSGAIEYNTTSYYINGKFVDEIPDSIIIRRWGYRLKDNMSGEEHTYREPIVMYHNDRLVSFCTVHRHWEKISCFYNAPTNNYIYMISKHRKSFKR